MGTKSAGERLFGRHVEVGLDRQRCAMGSNDLGRVTVALLGGIYPVIEVPGSGSLALSAADADDRAVIASSDGPVAQPIGVETRRRTCQPVACLTTVAVEDRSTSESASASPWSVSASTVWATGIVAGVGGFGPG